MLCYFSNEFYSFFLTQIARPKNFIIVCKGYRFLHFRQIDLWISNDQLTFLYLINWLFGQTNWLDMSSWWQAGTSWDSVSQCVPRFSQAQPLGRRVRFRTCTCAGTWPQLCFLQSPWCGGDHGLRSSPAPASRFEWFFTPAVWVLLLRGQFLDPCSPRWFSQPALPFLPQLCLLLMAVDSTHASPQDHTAQDSVPLFLGWKFYLAK